jgi:hypothetical protein
MTGASGQGSAEVDLLDRLVRLEHENAALREELRNQWEYNHSEHCSRVFPHPAGTPCYWPPLAILNAGLTITGDTD